MCGIAGVFLFDGSTPQESTLRKMASAIAHRGPDQEGFFLQGNVGLASRRLKIIDLSEAAAQPMSDEQGRFHCIFNGEIYNYRELRKEFPASQHFFSTSDTEVIIRIFSQQGEHTWSRLNGMFAIAIYDSVNRSLFLARDHAGIKPLYYYQDSSKLLFASELKALLATKEFPAEIDPSAISIYLQFGYFPAEWTPYRNVRKLLPGHCARISNDGMTIRKFWDSEAPKIAGPKNLTGPKMELDEILQEAIKHQMISDVPLGAFLSGGIDSSFIVAAMSRVSEEPVKTFTIGFTKMGYYDERSYAARVASLFHTEHHEFLVDQGIPEILPRLVSIFDEPFADSSAIPTLCLAELARKHVTVALSGTGGDEIFGGYRKYMAAQWVALYSSLPSSLRATVQKTSSLLPASRLSLWKERALLFQRFTGLNSEKPLHIQLNEIFSPTEVAEMLGSPAAEIEFRLSGKTVVEEMMAFDYANYLPEDLLVKEDRCTMAFGLEARVPLLDRTVIDFMNARPVKEKVSRTGSKILFKKVAAKYLPADIIKRPKHGFGSPVAEWLRGDLRELAEELLLSSRSFLSREAAKPLFAAHIGGADHSKKLWALVMLELWYAESLR